MSNQNQEPVLRIALQKSGRLSEDSLSLFKECGIKLPSGTGKLKTKSTNFPAEFLFLRDDDISRYVEDEVADVGIVGENVYVETQKRLKIVHRLGFSKCRLSIAVPSAEAPKYEDVSYLEGKEIATSYPNILEKHLKKNNVLAKIHEISGSVEIAPSIGLAHAVCDIVSSGSTLLSNGLKEVEKIFESEAILISNPKLAENKLALLDKLLFRIQAVQKAQNHKYILLNAPEHAIEKITSLIPGMKSPTIMPLGMKGWCSLHSVLEENNLWEIIESIRAAGGEDILVMPIEKMFD